MLPQGKSASAPPPRPTFRRRSGASRFVPRHKPKPLCLRKITAGRLRRQPGISSSACGHASSSAGERTAAGRSGPEVVARAGRQWFRSGLLRQGAKADPRYSLNMLRFLLQRICKHLRTLKEAHPNPGKARGRPIALHLVSCREGGGRRPEAAAARIAKGRWARSARRFDANPRRWPVRVRRATPSLSPSGDRDKTLPTAE